MVDKFLADIQHIDPCNENDLPDFVISLVGIRDPRDNSKRIVELRLTPYDYVVRFNG